MIVTGLYQQCTLLRGEGPVCEYRRVVEIAIASGAPQGVCMAHLSFCQARTRECTHRKASAVELEVEHILKKNRQSP